MRRLNFGIFISLLLIVGITLFSFWSNRQQVPKREEGFPPLLNEGADQRLEKVLLVEDKHGKKTWELEAKSIQQYRDQNLMVLDEVKLTFFTKEGRSFILSGKQAKVYQSTKDINLVGDVVLTSNDGFRLKTHSVHYDHQGKKVTTADPVEIEGEQIWLTGRGMLLDMEAQTFKILNEVKTRWRKGGRG